MNLLPNDTLLALVTPDADNKDITLGYVFAVAGAGGDEADQVQRWILFSRSKNDRPPKLSLVSIKDMSLVDPPLGGPLPPQDFSEATTLARFIDAVEEAFDDEMHQDEYLYVKANGKTTATEATEDPCLRRFPAPFKDLIPPFLGPEPDAMEEQADTGTRWLLKAGVIVGALFARRLDSAKVVEHWFLHDGYSVAAPFQLDITDIGLTADGPGTHQAMFINRLARPLGASDAMAVCSCGYYETLPASPDPM